MDRELDDKIQRRTRRRKWGRALALALLLLVGTWALRAALAPKARGSDFRMATLTTGPLESTIAATGLVTPSFEQQLNAPIAADIEQVFRRSGTPVKPGDLILRLNKTEVAQDVAARKSRLSLRRNAIGLLQLELDRDLKELQYDDQIKGLEVAAARTQLTDAQRLQKIGGGTAEEVEQAQTRLQILELEKSKLENELQYRRSSLAGRQREVALEADIQAQEVSDLERKLLLTEVRAPGAGVITWVNENIGEQVAEGQPLVRIADLRSFQIEGFCSDRYADRIKLGQPVRVRVNDHTITGHITNILPAVANNTVSFIVGLEVPDDDQLRPNMRLEIFVVTDRKEQALYVKQGPAFRGGLRQAIFVVRGNRAERIDVHTGVSNGEFIEVEGAGLQAGDRIIISDMTDFEHLDHIQLE
ncbi:MAG: HlyD family secretion protein [Bacteroidetes bacterium]|nr:MAG: HlyD family secretion protein [Bacteroidota bacterium]PTM12467.1 MAG: HlyD family secretion protein [Bacteroidota bacterium]